MRSERRVQPTVGPARPATSDRPGAALVPAMAVMLTAVFVGVGASPASAGPVGDYHETAVTAVAPIREDAASESAVAILKQQAEAIEKELAQSPRDERLLANLARTRINVANAVISEGAGESKGGVGEIKQQLSLADSAWSRYLKAAKKPRTGLAILVAPALFQRAELSSNAPEALKYVKAAVAAQKIVAANRPSKSSWDTLALYDLFAQRYNAADEALAKAIARANTRFEREALEKTFKEVEKKAKRFGKDLMPG